MSDTGMNGVAATPTEIHPVVLAHIVNVMLPPSTVHHTFMSPPAVTNCGPLAFTPSDASVTFELPLSPLGGT